MFIKYILSPTHTSVCGTGRATYAVDTTDDAIVKYQRVYNKDEKVGNDRQNESREGITDEGALGVEVVFLADRLIVYHYAARPIKITAFSVSKGTCRRLLRKRGCKHTEQARH